MVCYTIIAAWFFADVLPVATTHLPDSVELSDPMPAIRRADDQMVASTIGSVAQQLVTAPGHIHDTGHCYPFPNALTLGEPMFADAIVGVVPWLFTGNPVFTKNVVVFTAPILGAVFMFALILHWTNSIGAGLVAGLLFGFEPHRLLNVAHPYIHGNVWSPLALLFADRLFTRRTWWAAAMLTLALVMQMLESLYPALALALVGGTYGIVLAARHRRALPDLLPKLAVIIAVLSAVGIFAFAPYIRSQHDWGILQGRVSLLLDPASFHFGGVAFAGTILLALGAVALVDRARHHPSEAGDPRLPLLVGGALVYWLVVWSISVPLVGVFPSPYFSGLNELPGLGAVRAIVAVRTGIFLAGSCLAGFGVAALLHRRGPMTRALLTASIFALASGEIFFHPGSGAGFGVRYAPFEVAPPASLRTLLEQLPDGPVLDYPPSQFIGVNAHYLALAGFHGHPTDACYNSFRTPLQDEVRRLSASLPTPVAALRLRTLGFRGIIGHLEHLGPERKAAFRTWADGDAKRTLGLRRVGETADHVVYAIDEAPPTEGLAALATPPVGVGERGATVEPGASLGLTVRNGTRAFYRHPDPIRPSPVTLTWRDRDDTVVTAERLKVLLPLALVPGQTIRLAVTPTALPPPGTYGVTLRLGDDGTVLARQTVTVLPPPAIDGPR